MTIPGARRLPAAFLALTAGIASSAVASSPATATTLPASALPTAAVPAATAVSFSSVVPAPVQASPAAGLVPFWGDPSRGGGGPGDGETA